jgi:hypothetical protein
MKTIHGFTPSENAAFNTGLRKELIAEVALLLTTGFFFAVLIFSFTF